jgi:DNA mismatch endonuclease, patch repair protein
MVLNGARESFGRVLGEGEGEPPPSAQRSALMSRVRGKNTTPELSVRRAAHRLGYRFRIHRRDLPGTPDLVFPGQRLALFVHGCFWHRHGGCRRCTTPKTRADFWQSKFGANIARDRRSAEALKAAGWRVETIWECEAAVEETLVARLNRLLGEASRRDPGAPTSLSTRRR